MYSGNVTKNTNNDFIPVTFSSLRVEVVQPKALKIIPTINNGIKIPIVEYLTIFTISFVVIFKLFNFILYYFLVLHHIILDIPYLIFDIIHFFLNIALHICSKHPHGVGNTFYGFSSIYLNS